MCNGWPTHSVYWVPRSNPLVSIRAWGVGYGHWDETTNSFPNMRLRTFGDSRIWYPENMEDGWARATDGKGPTIPTLDNTVGLHSVHPLDYPQMAHSEVIALVANAGWIVEHRSGHWVPKIGYRATSSKILCFLTAPKEIRDLVEERVASWVERVHPLLKESVRTIGTEHGRRVRADSDLWMNDGALAKTLGEKYGVPVLSISDAKHHFTNEADYYTILDQEIKRVKKKIANSFNAARKEAIREACAFIWQSLRREDWDKFCQFVATLDHFPWDMGKKVEVSVKGKTVTLSSLSRRNERTTVRARANCWEVVEMASPGNATSLLYYLTDEKFKTVYALDYDLLVREKDAKDFQNKVLKMAAVYGMTDKAGNSTIRKGMKKTAVAPSAS